MTLAEFYLVCFLVGFLLSVVSLLVGAFDLHFPHVDVPHLHVHLHLDAAGSQGGLAPFNVGTVAAFLAWFGGAGYLLERYSGFYFMAGLGLATLSGLAGAVLIFFFLAKVLLAKEQNLNPADYEMIGVLARISNPIRTGGTGEIVFSQQGTRHVAGARSEDGAPIAKGAEVVVTRYEKGIAYVKAWDELMHPTKE